ncbi:MAG: phospholipase [Paludibacteraceae bacterium]|nr:phospholipase [Paludibacteraceae bacterium]
MSDLFCLLAFVAICVLYYFLDKKRKASKKETSSIDSIQEPNSIAPRSKERPEGCCGAHEVCEKESLINNRVQPEYYDDEELDAFAGRTADSYDEDEIRLFSDVFYTLKDYDVAGWLKSLQARNVELPLSLRDEALLIVQERRFKSHE